MGHIVSKKRIETDPKKIKAIRDWPRKIWPGKFEVYTDNNPLTYILTTAKLDATGQRWVASLANYNFKLFYKSGRTNIEADALSRIPWNAEFDNDSVKTIILAKSSQWSPLHETWSSCKPELEGRTVFTVKQAHVVPHSKETKDNPVRMTNEQWQTIQSADPDLNVIITLLKKKKLSKRKGNVNDSDDLRTMLRHRNNYVPRNNLLYKKIKSSQEDVITMQFVLPKQYRLKALKACHDDCGHFGREKCDSLLRDRFYWPNMTRGMADHIKRCDRCLRFKAKERS